MKNKVLKINGTRKHARWIPLLISLCLIGSLNLIQVQAENTKELKKINLDAAVLGTGDHQICFGTYQERAMK